MVAASFLPTLPFSAVLVANRGEVAIRLIRAVHDLNLRAIAVFVSDDATSPHILHADQAISLGAAPGAYADAELLLQAAQSSGAGAVLPGYGFSSEDPRTAALFEDAGIIWAGPDADAITLFGLKHTAREAAIAAEVPTIPGSEVLTDVEHALRAAEVVGYPALLKASAGGGGMGQAVVRNADHLRRTFDSVLSQARALFANPDIYLERYISSARHIEVQIFGDGRGKVVALGDRECSVQRRRQKVIEEGSAPNLAPRLREVLRQAAVRLCAKHKYRSAGTVEFILDADSDEWFFLEVNTRLQVEHGVTELVSGVDIVRWMILLAGGIPVLEEDAGSRTESGAAIEARIYAENPAKDYVPCPGTLTDVVWPEETVCANTGSRVRVDGWAQRGTTIPGHYDPLLGKVMTWGRTRSLAIAELRRALKEMAVKGVPCNIELLLQVTEHPDFLQGTYTTSLLNTFTPATKSIEVVKPGLQTSIQDYPGRTGYWNIGVSPSGPMDAYAMGMANALVGNPSNSSAIEMTVTGPLLLFHCDAVVALAGSQFQVKLDDGKHVDFWTPFEIKAGSSLHVGQVYGEEQARAHGFHGSQAIGGSICYLAIRGGIDAPKYLGSAATFPTGKFGGITGSFFASGDFLPIGCDDFAAFNKAEQSGVRLRWPVGTRLPEAFIPSYDRLEWEVGALNGPHASNDFLHDETLDSIWKTSYVVHHAKNRLGARLIGPAPRWTRADGGSAGLHPSNLHDYTYAPGAVNFSGNTPIILMLDGPSLGGFVCPITVASAELWKVAQAMPGEKIRFKQINYDDASAAFSSMESAWNAVRLHDVETLKNIAETWSPWWSESCEAKSVPSVLASVDPANGGGAELKVVYRMSGDEHILIEYGNIELNIAYRMRVHMLMEELKDKLFVDELCPGVRSLLVKYDRRKIHVNKLIDVFTELESRVMGSVDDVSVPSRVLRLPLAFDDKWTRDAQKRYLQSIRPDAPYMPSNVEFIRRINGLESTEEVRNIMTAAQYMVLGLGDVYLGAPCAVPVDPRHRLVTSKYNPARTYTPEGAVGIGGAYMCIYGMDSPGGYQLAGRTLPIWDSYGSIPAEKRGAPKEIPWLLRFFDRIEYFAVSDDELERLRSEYIEGEYTIEILEERWSYAQYVEFCESNKESIAEFKAKRTAAYDVERSRWEADGEEGSNAAADHARREASNLRTNSLLDKSSAQEAPAFSVPVLAGMAASVWASFVGNGDKVEKGDQLFSLESMKVEISVEAPISGIIQKITVGVGDNVSSDTELCSVVSNEEGALRDSSIDSIREVYDLGILSVSRVVKTSLARGSETAGIFSVLADPTVTDDRVAEVENARYEKHYLPLYGIPFVVADDIDVDGYRSQQACPEVAYKAKTSNLVIRALMDAGAILVGKTSIDQLNCGNTGLEYEGAAPANPLFPGYITGGNGAAAACIQKHIASFAVVVDRNGTSTLAPALCAVIGLKTTEGFLPLSQSEMTCAGTDCLSIYASNAVDLRRVLDICTGARGHSNPTLRMLPHGKLDDQKRLFRGMKLALCSTRAVKQFLREDEDAICAYERAMDCVQALGYKTMQSDMSAFSEAATLLDHTPIQYARLGKLQASVRRMKSAVLPSVADRIMTVDENLSASAFGAALGELEICKRKAGIEIWNDADAALLPISTSACSAVDASKDVGKANQQVSQLSRLLTALDLCVITLHLPPPADSEAPQGVFVVAPAFQESLLIEFATRW